MDLVRPGPQLLTATEHDPRPAILCIVVVTREDIFCHLLQNQRLQLRCDGLVPFFSVWVHHIYVKVPGDKELHAPRARYNDRHNVLQGGGFVRRKKSSENVPAAPFRLHLEDGDVRDVQLKFLRFKLL